MKIIYAESGFEEIYLKDNIINIEVEIQKNIDKELLIHYCGNEQKRQILMNVEQGAHVNVLLKNEGTARNDISQQINVQKDGKAVIAFWEIEEGNTEIQTDVYLLENGADVTLKSATIASNSKIFKLNCVHKVPYTYSKMENYAIVKDHAKFVMEAIGKIEKGAYTSESYQVTRVLTLTDEHQSCVTPILLIDENDVKASHATTLGQPDENQLYYLQSRGLTRAQALGLLTLGYLTPISELFKDGRYAVEMKQEIEKRVGLHD